MSEHGLFPMSGMNGKAVAATPCGRLPTLQRNALRKLFDRAEFSPEEVAQLGYRRILQAEGIGQKGMRVIEAWLAEYGFVLAADTQGDRVPGRPLSRRGRKDLESAIRILREHGYEILRADSGTAEP